MEELGWLGDTRKHVICECAGKLRLTGPHYFRPFAVDAAVGSVWGVGEAIGCVAPLAGDGIVPGMRSVRILLDTWDDPEGYAKTVLEEFHWMKNERKVIDKLRKGEHLGIQDAWVLKKNSRRMGMRVSLRQAAMLIRNLR